MLATEHNGMLCVELDTGSIFSEYLNYLESITIFEDQTFTLAETVLEDQEASVVSA